jgi:hypothetical protein
MFASLLAALAIAVAPQEQTAAVTPDQTSDAVRLEDVEVTGRRLDSLIRSFVDEVAAPNPNRGIARWDTRLCVGVANLRGEAAQYLVDRVSTVAEDIGLTPGAPGCKPNLMIIATEDGGALAAELVRQHKGALRMGGSGMDQGGAALRRFQETDRPVRWWQVSMPVDSETGMRATRIPGECTGTCTNLSDFAPTINVFAASRLSTQIIDNIFRTIVIVDVSQTSDVNINQLADYIAMVSLAQINPDADTSAYASILNVFAEPDGAAWLTDWDRAYLAGLYDAERTRKSLRAGRSEIAASIHRAHEQSQSDQPE